MEGTRGDTEIVDKASDPSKRPCVSLPARVDKHVRTGKCGRDGLSGGDSLSLPGFTDRELSPRASAVSVVFREDAFARGDGGALAGTRADAAEDTSTRRSSLSTAEADGCRAAEVVALEHGFGSLY